MESIYKKITKDKSFIKRLIVVAIFLIIVVICFYVNARGKYIQMLEMGEQYAVTYMENFSYSFYAFLATTLILYIAISLTTLFIKKGLRNFFITEKKEMPKFPNKSISLILSVLISAIISPNIAEQFMLYTNFTYFGNNDPIFNFDIGFYIFQKPFIEMILFYIVILIVGLSIYLAVYYIIAFNRYFDGIDVQMLKNSNFVKQLIVNGIILSLIIGVIVFIKTQDILLANFISSNINTGLTLHGAGTIDVNIKLWGYRILSIMIVASICMALYYIIRKNKKRVVISFLLVPIYLICLFVVSMLYDIVFVRSNEFDREKEYISYNIDNTKRAFNINIEEKELEYSGTITFDQIMQNQEILQNIPIIDENITLTTLKEFQSNVGFYSFNNIQMCKYNNYLQYLTPREIITSGTITDSSRIYEYTHGYSAIITSAVETDEYGNVKYIQSDFNNQDDKVKITQPRIYFGLETNNDIIVNANNKVEYDYPLTTTTNATNVYDGKAGISLNALDRFILGLNLGNINIAFGIDMNENSKILTNRQILERAEKVLPYIMYDENPYLVVTDEGRLVWVIDGYTSTNKYPYSSGIDIEYNGKKQNINYIRNSVKVLIDAFDGDMKFYIIDREDPIIMAYNKIHPNLFAKADESIPSDIQKHLVYPKFLYEIQSRVLVSYHDIQPEVLYRNDDVWEVATYYQGVGTTGKIAKIEPYYTIVNDSNIGLVLPYTEYNKKNINAYLIGTTNGVSKNLTLYKFNSNNNVLGPIQLENQIEEDETISEEVKTISLTGTKLLKNTLIIPVANTVLYVEPIYQIRLNETQIPVLKKVIVASGNKLAIGDNFKQALNNLLSQYAVNIQIENSDEDYDGLIEQIIKANNNLKESSSNLDWGLMGRDIERLQTLITQLENMKKEEVSVIEEEELIKPESDLNIVNAVSDIIE